MSVCVSVSVGKGVGAPTGVRGDTQNGEPRVWRRAVGKPVWSSWCFSLSLFLHLPYLWFLAPDLSRWRGGWVCLCLCLCVCVCVCDPPGDQALSRARMALGLRVGLGRGAAPGIA